MDPAPRRRRIEEPTESAEGRTGCLALGALLGVAAGVLFVLFGLSPLLRWAFPDPLIAPGESFEGDAKVLSVQAVTRDERTILVTMSAQTNKPWRPAPTDFELELEGGRRVTALAASTLVFVPGERRPLVLAFAAAPGERPRELRLAAPRVRFALPPEAP